jgi:hypothetical protein
VGFVVDELTVRWSFFCKFFCIPLSLSFQQCLVLYSFYLLSVLCSIDDASITKCTLKKLMLYIFHVLMCHVN